MTQSRGRTPSKSWLDGVEVILRKREMKSKNKMMNEMMHKRDGNARKAWKSRVKW